MGDMTFKLDGANARPFREYRGLQIELNFEGDNLVNFLGGSEVIDGQLSTNQFTFTHENADTLNARLLAGSLGVHWGVPLEASKENLKILDAFIDLSNGAVFSCEQVTAKIMERKQKDWMNEEADGFDFRYLESIGIISESDFGKMPYIVSSIPDYKSALILSVTGFVLVVELQRTIKDLVNILSDLAGTFSTIAGVLKLIYFVVYLGLLIFAIVKLVKELVFLFIQPIKYHYTMTELKHWEAIASHLNFTFSSSFFQDNVPTNSVDEDGVAIPSGLWKDEVWMPTKSKVGAFKGQAPQEKGYYEGSGGNWIRDQAKLKNGKVFIIGDVLHFERRDFTSSSTSYQIPDVKRDEFKLNTDEFVASVFYEFAIDLQDENTVNDIDGSNVKTITSSINNGVDGTELMKGLLEIRPECALGRRKNELTEIEQGFLDLFQTLQPLLNTMYDIGVAVVKVVAVVVKVVNKIIGALNSLPKVRIKKLNVPNSNLRRLNLAVSIKDRIGMLLLSTDFTSKPKLLLTEGSGDQVKIPANAQTVLSGETMVKLYYFIESFVPSIGNPIGNQWYLWNIENINFCVEDVQTIRGFLGEKDGEAKVTSPEGRPARISSILWTPWSNVADIRYREHKQYDFNLQLTYQKNSG